MATGFNTETKEIRRSMNTPDYDLPWRLDLDLSAVRNVPQKYRKYEGGEALEMTAAEKQAVDDAEAQARQDSEILELDTGMMRRFIIVLIDEVNRLRTRANMPTITVQDFKDAMRNK